MIADPISAVAVDLFSEYCHVDLAADVGREVLLARLSDAEALIVRSATTVDVELLDAAPELFVVGRAGVGLDNIDVEAATVRGVVVVNAPEANIISAAEHTMALLLGLARHLPQADQQLRSGVWDRSSYQGVELHGKTLGILGLGRIGSLVAERVRAFGMRLLAYDPYISAERAEEVGVAGAALDVFAVEPTNDSLLFDLSNVVVTPHVAASTAEAQDRAGVETVRRVLDVLHFEHEARFDGAAGDGSDRTTEESIRRLEPEAIR